MSTRRTVPPRSPEIETFMSGGVRLRRTPVALARRFFQICTSAVAEAIASEGVTSPRMGVLVALSKETGEPGIDQNGLAARLGVERARVSQLVDELESARLIERRVSGADRRARLLRLTSQGERLHARAHPLGIAAQMGVLETLTPAERKLLLDLLTKVIQANSDRPRAIKKRQKPHISQPRASAPS
jgi:MarR family transcriptional regulator, lower aerobic nicotinate degradation pathway regulator